MQVSVIEAEGSQLEALVPEWRGLAEARGNPFVTPEWYFAAAGGTPRIAVARAREDGRLAGLLPLRVESWRGLRALRFGGYRLGDRFHPVAALEAEPAVAAGCVEGLLEIGERRLRLDKCDDVSGWLSGLPGGGASTLSFKRTTAAKVPRVTLAGRDWQGYLQSRSKNLRSRIGRMERKLIREHGMTIRRTRTAAELQGDFQTLFALHDARRQQKGGTSLAPGPLRDQLFAFCAASLERGWLRLRIMECDGRPAAVFLGWRLGGRYCFYQSGFDPAWGRLSVGLVSLALAIREAFEEGAAEFDLLLGDEEYKLRLADGEGEVTSGVLAPRFDLAAAIAYAESGLRAVRGH